MQETTMEPSISHKRRCLQVEHEIEDPDLQEKLDEYRRRIQNMEAQLERSTLELKRSTERNNDLESRKHKLEERCKDLELKSQQTLKQLLLWVDCWRNEQRLSEAKDIQLRDLKQQLALKNERNRDLNRQIALRDEKKRKAFESGSAAIVNRANGVLNEIWDEDWEDDSLDNDDNDDNDDSDNDFTEANGDLDNSFNVDDEEVQEARIAHVSKVSSSSDSNTGSFAESSVDNYHDTDHDEVREPVIESVAKGDVLTVSDGTNVPIIETPPIMFSETVLENLEQDPDKFLNEFLTSNHKLKYGLRYRTHELAETHILIRSAFEGTLLSLRSSKTTSSGTWRQYRCAVCEISVCALKDNGELSMIQRYTEHKSCKIDDVLKRLKTNFSLSNRKGKDTSKVESILRGLKGGELESITVRNMLLVFGVTSEYYMKLINIFVKLAKDAENLSFSDDVIKNLAIASYKLLNYQPGDKFEAKMRSFGVSEDLISRFKKRSQNGLYNVLRDKINKGRTTDDVVGTV